MINGDDYGRKGRAVKTALVLFVCFLVVFLFLALGETEALPGVLVEEISSGGEEILLFDEKEDQVWLASGSLDSTLLLKLDRTTGEALARREIVPALHWAALRGNFLFGREDVDDTAKLLCWNAQTLEPVSERELALNQMDIILFDCDDSGTAFSVLNKNRNTLKVYLSDGEEETDAFPSEIGFLAVDSENSLVIYAEESLYMGEYGNGPLQEISGFPQPVALLEPGMWIDTGGMVRRLGEQGVSSVLQTEEEVFSSRFYCVDQEGGLFLSVGSGTVRRYETESGLSRSFTVEGTVLGLCAWGVLSEKDGKLLYTCLESLQDTPSPSPSFSPSPSPTPDPEDPAWVEGDYLVAPAGTTAAGIRELMEPEAADIRDKMGNQVIRGRLSTGMTVNDWTVVIVGDCDGSGTVTGADVRKAMEMSLNGEKDISCFSRAADLDNDGAISAADLTRLSNMASGG